MNVAVVTLWLAALMFATFGVWLLLAPERLDDWLSLTANTPAARTELRALYGGLELGIAAFCVFCALEPARHSLGCIAVAMFLSGIGAARVYGMVRDHSASPQMFWFLATEFVTVGLAVWGAIRTRGV